MTSSRPPGAPERRVVRGPRRPPARVFWVRRLVALTLTGGLVWALVGLIGMLDLSADGETEPPQATTAGATPAPAPSSGPDSSDRSDRSAASGRRDGAAAERRAAARALRLAERAEKRDELAVPTGPCAGGDVVVTPQIPDAHAGGDVVVELELTTEESAACTFELDPDDVFVTIADKKSLLWSSQHCPAALPTATAVPRRTTPDTVSFTWNGKESMTGCAVDTSWVFPGVYRVTAVARGSVNPVETLFTLGEPAEGSEASTDADEKPGGAERPRRTDEAATRADEAPDPSDGRSDEPETEEQAAERREARREALREARRQHRADRQAERDVG